MFNKRIVIYGCDNSGKSTACEKAKKILEGKGLTAEVIHSCGPLSANEQLYFMADKTNNQEVDVVVFDRFPAIEEIVYGPIIRGENKLSKYETQCRMYMDRISLFIFCCPPFETITNWGDREQMDGVKERAERIVMAYYNKVPGVYPGISYRTVEYDWTKDGDEGLEKIITRWLEDEHYSLR